MGNIPLLVFTGVEKLFTIVDSHLLISGLQL